MKAGPPSQPPNYSSNASMQAQYWLSKARDVVNARGCTPDYSPIYIHVKDFTHVSYDKPCNIDSSITLPKVSPAIGGLVGVTELLQLTWDLIRVQDAKDKMEWEVVIRGRSRSSWSTIVTKLTVFQTPRTVMMLEAFCKSLPCSVRNFLGKVITRQIDKPNMRPVKAWGCAFWQQVRRHVSDKHEKKKLAERNRISLPLPSALCMISSWGSVE